LGGVGITGTTDDTVYVPYLNVQSATTNNTLAQVLVIDTNGDVKKRDVSSISGGSSFTGGTVTGATSFTNNLTVSGGTSIFSGNSSSDLVRITQDGSGNAFVVEDVNNPDGTPFVIDTNGNVGMGTLTPSEKLDISGAIKIQSGGYTSLTNGATTPVPTGGAGTMVFDTVNSHFFGWNGTSWRQLDN
jgi:hypothetical protein